MDKISNVMINQYREGTFVKMEDTVIAEYALTLYINNKEYANLLCSPEHLEALVIGYLVSEYIIETYEDITSLTIDEDKGLAYVDISETFLKGVEFKARYITSGCASSAIYYNTLDAIKLKSRKRPASNKVSMKHVIQSMIKVNQHSDTFKLTGGVHIAALFNDNEALYFVEDIGRHNAVDKIIGIMVKNKVDSRGKMLLTSGRISSEMVLKCAKYNINVLVSKSAPMDKAIRIAEELNVILIGFVRGQRGNIYSGESFVEL